MSRRYLAGALLLVGTLLLAAAVLAMLLSSSAGGPRLTPALPAPAEVEFGTNVNRLFNARQYSSAQINGHLSALRATGATIARSDALWELTEPSPPASGLHHYNWSFDDNVAAALARARLRWLPILDYSAGWARADPVLLHSPPRDPAVFAAWAAAFARRYGPGGEFWSSHPALPSLPVETYEVWNEPDNGQFWQPAPDPGAYARLYGAARAAIASAEPGARVIVGGLTRPGTFLPALLAASPQLRGHLDGVAIHPYGRTPAVVLAKVRRDRATLEALSLGSVPLYVTELGWTTSPTSALNYAAPSQRPAYIRRSVAQLAAGGCGVAAIVLYTWVTPERNRLDPEDWYGLEPPSDSSLTADAKAWRAAIHHALYAQRSATPLLLGQCSSASTPRLKALNAGLA